MIGSLLPRLLASAAIVSALPSAWVDNDNLNSFGKRALFPPISTSSPLGIPGGSIANDAPPVASFFAGLKPPFPTNSWWAPYAATPGNATAAGPYPYQSNLDGFGVNFGISTRRDFDGTSIHQPTQNDWRASFAEHTGNFANHKATAFDTQTVTVQYFQGNAQLTAYLVPGSPYITFQYSGATPLLTSQSGGIVSFNGKAIAAGQSTTASGTQFTVTDSAGSTYLIYSLSSIALTATATSAAQGTIRASGAFTGVLRVVKLNNAAHKALLDAHYQAYATSVNLDYSFTDTTGTLTFSWNTVGDASQLLLLTWPHHRAALVGANQPATSSLSYLTTKGYMYPILGNTWNQRYSLSSITWNPPRPLDSSCTPQVIKGLEYDVSQLNASQPSIPGDFYGWGSHPPVLNYLKASFNYWFQANSPVVAAYETRWGGVINKAGALNDGIDYGNGIYNDHHFHYGYFLATAATIAKYDGNWLNQHRDFINWFARDIINPSPNDPYFPITRCRDWFAGHSWASGVANGAGSRDQESSGEAVNGYYGALLWASVALSQDYVNYAKLLVATEQQGAKIYWHLYPSQSQTDPNNPYPEPAARNLISMGNVEDWQAGAWLFWGDQKSEIAAIQILPITPINEVLYDAEWVRNVWNYTAGERADPGIGDEWKNVIMAAYSNANPQEAANAAASITNWGSGNTFSNEIYFIGTRPNPSGQPICGAFPTNPQGNFKLQVATSGQYVSSSATNTNLVANTNSGAAAVFSSGYVPNAGTLKLTSTNQFVTADSSGNFALQSARPIASAWEIFTIRQKVGQASGVYSIRASSNGKYVTVGGDGSLLNNGANEAASAGFRFIAS
ncbi:Glucan endo-1,3-beta-D-glucosidase -like protein [Cladobotryum mycophilum]|uniref:glucan endo-1,3-beta-D-glucosidase n=1 Tax=Cladobotryum mycophilum TaxID=491253 RepID=A0ABR0SQV9_9HYPO